MSGMKRKLKGIIAGILCICMLSVSLPAGIFADTNELKSKTGLDFSSNTYIAGRLDLLFELLVYSDAPYFTVSGVSSCGNTACADCSLAAVSAGHPKLGDLGIEFSTVAYGSGAFARYAFALIFGTKLTAINLFGNTTAGLQTIGRVAASKMAISGEYSEMNLSNLRDILLLGTPGDLIQARSASGVNHTMVFLKASDAGVTVLHSVDYAMPEVGYNKVVISEISYETMLKTWDQVISLMRAEQEVYEAALKKGEELHLTHTYSDEGQDTCLFCDEVYTAQESYALAGVYKAVKDTCGYIGKYRSTGSTGKEFAKGTYAEVIGSVVNSTGVAFYRLADGGYVSSEDFTSDTENTPQITATKYPAGEVSKGRSFDLDGTVYMGSGLSEMTGYLIRSDGTIAQKKQINVNSVSVNIGRCDINSNLKFSLLDIGEYTYMITAKGKNGRMSCFTSKFTVIVPVEKETPEAPSAPEAREIGATYVKLKEKTGCEYKKEGGSWQKSPDFSGLSPATQYVFYARLAETDTMNASPASAGKTIKTDKAVPQEVKAPTVAAVTATTVTLQKVAGCEYKCGSGAWQASNVFTGLSPATEYTFCQRIAETDVNYAGTQSGECRVTTAKLSSDAPAAPTQYAVYSDSVVLVPISGYEYRCGEGAWQTSNVFTGLRAATEYAFYQRVAATATADASASSEGLYVKTAKRNASAPTPPVIGEKTATTVTLKKAEGYEYRCGSGAWQTSNVFSGLSPNTAYTFYQRIAETETSMASDQSKGTEVMTAKLTVQPPAVPVVEKLTDRSVKLKAVAGCEYRIDGGAWQQSPEFTGLLPAKSYVFGQRYAETDTAYASAVSEKTITTEKSAGKTAAAPTLKSVTSDTVVLNTVPGCEYRIDGGKWQQSPVFTGVTPNTANWFYQRYAETGDTYAGASSTYLEVRTPKSTPNAPASPVLLSYTDSSVTVKTESGTEYSIDGKSWQSGGVFTGLVSNTEYGIYARLKETDRANASAPSAPRTVRTDYTSVEAPTAPKVLSVVDKTVTLVGENGMEYSVDGGETWQESAVFTLPDYGVRTFCRRSAATERCYPSPASKALTVEVYPTRLTSSVLKVDEENKLIGGITVGMNGEKLLDLLNEGAFILSVRDASQKELDLGPAIVTGTQVVLYNGTVYTVAVKGDIDEDGEITVFDLVEIKNQILYGDVLEKEKLLAADANMDGIVDIFDYSAVRGSILNGTAL